jgi:hypothetical protein
MTGILNLLAGAVGVVKDTYFNLVTLLLPGDGTNGAQNNTFLDSSTNNFTITRNGNTTQGTFSPFSQTGWSVNNTSTAPGSTNLYTIANNAALQMGAGDFTVELWVYITGQSGTDSYTGIFSLSGVYGTANTCLEFTMEPNGGIGVNSFTNTTTNFYVNLIAGNSGLAFNRWNHLAVCRSGTTVYAFTNGILQGTVTGNSTNINGTGIGAIFLQRLNSTTATPGYLSNVRVVKGTALYTSSFTPSTAPLTAVTNTTLLTCQSNRFIDNSTNNFAITVNSGFASVQAFSPFAPTAAYSAATNGGSGYFDGNGDELNAGSNAAFSFGTGAYTVEFWTYLNAAVSASHEPCFVFNDTTGGFGIYNSLSGMQIATRAGASALSSTTMLVPYTWNYVVAVRSGTGANQTSLFVNGSRVANGTDSTNWTITGPFKVGGISLSNFYVNGYISSVRVVKGTAVYDPTQTSITVPTAPPTAVTNTQFLLNFTNAGITDATAKNDLETVGNAQISTTQSKFGGSSIRFDGTGDWLSGTPVTKDLFAFGTGDFTVEFWAWKSANGAGGYDGVICLTDSRSSGSPSWFVELSSSRGFLFYVRDGVTNKFCQNNTTTGINDSTWHYWTICRSGSTWYLFKDGTALTKTTDTIGATSIPGGTFLDVGRSIDLGGTTEFNGYINDLRVTKGYARYTANFTPPSTALPLR